MKYSLDWNKYIEKAREVVSEGCVLLENKRKILPLKEGAGIAIFGRAQLNYYKSGTGSGGMVNVSGVVGIPEGLRASGSVNIDAAIESLYKEWEKENPYEKGLGWGAEPDSQKEMHIDDETIRLAAERNDTALVIFGRTAGEDRDIAAEEGSWKLTDEEKDLLKRVKSQFKETVVILNVGNIIDMSFVTEYDIDTLIYVWQGGQAGGLGTADILTGKVSPSGKLTDTVALTLEDYPAHSNYGNPEHVSYEEDIYVGYRYFETAAKDKVMYPFGYGLSYTSFSIMTSASTSRASSDSALCQAGAPVHYKEAPVIDFSVRVKNTGDRAGKETVQIYAGLPQGKMGKAARNLVAFKKTKLLEPGEIQELSFTIDTKELASFDDTGISGNESCFVLEPGLYTLYAGTDVRAELQAASFFIDGTLVTSKATKAFSPVKVLNRLKAVEDKASKTGISFVRETVEPAEPYQNKHREENLAKVREDVKKILEKGDELSSILRQLTDDDLACIIRGEGMGSPKVTPGTAAAFGGVSPHLAELGIPCGCCSDGPSGMRLDSGAEAFSLPSGTLQAATFNPELITELYFLTGQEMLYNKVDILLGPGMNIRRYPLNGRNFEYFSEDPYITGLMAAATVKGLHKAGVSGAMKHFCCNNQETGRLGLDVTVSERALREIYLKGFEIAVKSGADVIMTSYGSTNSMWAAGNFDLVTRILRNEWGFKGFVMTDWWANINSECQGPCKTDFAQMARAQNDVYMTTPDGAANIHGDNTAASLAEGSLTREELLRNAANIISFLQGSHAKKRLSGIDDSVEILNRKKNESITDPDDIECYALGKEFTLETKGLDTSRGSSYVFTLDATEGPGQYDFFFYGKASEQAAAAAQIPIALGINGLSITSITWNGSEKESSVKEKELLLATKYSVIKLNFVQSGLELEKIVVKKL
ncbi:MAG: glycoside hydrolase family 3 C-terminal domain-containing protein [Treponemataceae bacterium]|nr:glycoside hydrolase family 3 C-terminal domain-containing protein [Treponemataceae bacterium]